jgi:hypothetical protein
LPEARVRKGLPHALPAASLVIDAADPLIDMDRGC